MRRQTARDQLRGLRAVVPEPVPDQRTSTAPRGRGGGSAFANLDDGPLVTRAEFDALFPDDEIQPPPPDDGSQVEDADAVRRTTEE
jgi:hypothetical protein